jgi:hypothetical protein
MKYTYRKQNPRKGWNTESYTIETAADLKAVLPQHRKKESEKLHEILVNQDWSNRTHWTIQGSPLHEVVAFRILDGSSKIEVAQVETIKKVQNKKLVSTIAPPGEIWEQMIEVESQEALGGSVHKYLNREFSGTPSKDLTLATDLITTYWARNRELGIPHVGDIIILKNGEERRAGHVHDYMNEPFIQTTSGGSFALTESGNMEYSGGFDDNVKIKNIKFVSDTSQRSSGDFWIFSNGYRRGGNAVRFKATLPIWRES